MCEYSSDEPPALLHIKVLYKVFVQLRTVHFASCLNANMIAIAGFLL